jgi:hypothetical protein
MGGAKRYPSIASYGDDGFRSLPPHRIYNLFRLAGITQGIAGRVRDGTAANAKAMESAKRAVPLSQASREYAQKADAK